MVSERLTWSACVFMLRAVSRRQSAAFPALILRSMSGAQEFGPLPVVRTFTAPAQTRAVHKAYLQMSQLGP